jgi:hypothetical protein
VTRARLVAVVAALAPLGTPASGQARFETERESPTLTVAPRPAGTYLVGLRVLDFQGASDTSLRTIEVIENRPPTASFSFSPSSPRTGEEVIFDASASSDPDGHGLTFGWNFDGDGQLDRITDSQTTIWTYFTGGTKLVRLLVVDEADASAEATRELFVRPPEALGAGSALSLGSPFPPAGADRERGGSRSRKGAASARRPPACDFA